MLQTSLQDAKLSFSQIGQLKGKIQSDKGWEVGQQKLIYSGMHALSALRRSETSAAIVANRRHRQDPARCEYDRIVQHRREGLHCLHGVQGTYRRLPPALMPTNHVNSQRPRPPRQVKPLPHLLQRPRRHPPHLLPQHRPRPLFRMRPLPLLLLRLSNPTLRASMTPQL